MEILFFPPLEYVLCLVLNTSRYHNLPCSMGFSPVCMCSAIIFQRYDHDMNGERGGGGSNVLVKGPDAK